MNEALRKAAHLVLGISLVGILEVHGHSTAFAVLVALLGVVIALSDALQRGYRVPIVTPVIALVGRPNRIPLYGAILYTTSTLVCLIFFGPAIAARAILAFTVLDAAAALGGQSLGKRRIYNGKSIEGFGIGLVSAAAVLFLWTEPRVAMLMAGVGSLVELLSPIDDNLIVPISAAFAASFFL
jgi:dolichol kinase